MSYVHPLAFQTIAILLTTALSESLSVDEQAVIGAFFSVLGDMLSFNSSYLAYVQSYLSSDQDMTDKQETLNQDQDEQYDLLKKSIEKIENELKKMKQ